MITKKIEKKEVVEIAINQMNIRELVEVKTIKIMILSPSLLSCESLVSVKENTDRKRKKSRMKERKKNTDITQTKLSAPHVRYNVKMLPQ